MHIDETCFEPSPRTFVAPLNSAWRNGFPEHSTDADSDRLLASTILDLFPVAVAVIDRAGHILYLNRAAERIIAADDGLHVIRGRLTAARPGDQARLQHRLREMSDAERDGATLRWAALRIDRESGAPQLLLLLPLRSIGHQGVPHGGCAGLLMAIITDPGRPINASTALLRESHGLTAAEAEILGRLADGMRLAQIAADLDISVATVRCHLKAIFGKTGTSRQADLIRYTLLGGAWMQGNGRDAAAAAVPGRPRDHGRS